jgi:hypothetical protein
VAMRYMWSATNRRWCKSGVNFYVLRKQGGGQDKRSDILPAIDSGPLTFRRIQPVRLMVCKGQKQNKGQLIRARAAGTATAGTEKRLCV